MNEPLWSLEQRNKASISVFYDKLENYYQLNTCESCHQNLLGARPSRKFLIGGVASLIKNSRSYDTSISVYFIASSPAIQSRIASSRKVVQSRTDLANVLSAAGDARRE
jgi:hypothetical protein